MKHLVWRATKNYLPTAANLIQKRVEIDKTCPICKVHDEKIKHALLWCYFAKQIWALHGFNFLDF